MIVLVAVSVSFISSLINDVDSSKKVSLKMEKVGCIVLRSA